MVTLRGLLASGFTVRCLVLADHRSAAPGRVPVPLEPAADDPAAYARFAGIPVVSLSSRKILSTLVDTPEILADVAIVSCFPWRLPSRILSWYPYGTFNIHPSLLPEYRGPSPLFWQYRDGRLESGVTVHCLTEDLDAGPIVAQTRCTLPLAFPGDRLEAWLAWYGVGLVRRVFSDSSAPQCRAQSSESSTDAPLTGPESCTIDWSWPAWRAAHFLGGVLPLGYRIDLSASDGTRWRVRRFHAWTRSHRPPRAPARTAGPIAVSLRDGVLWIEGERL